MHLHVILYQKSTISLTVVSRIFLFNLEGSKVCSVFEDHRSAGTLGTGPEIVYFEMSVSFLTNLHFQMFLTKAHHPCTMSTNHHSECLVNKTLQ
jgi:hypothetical protein